MTDIYRVLSDPTRRKIIGLLAKQPHTQKDIVQHFDISQPAILKHLRLLIEEGVIEERKAGKYRLYSLDRNRFEQAYQIMIKEIENMLDDQLKRLKKYVERDDHK